MNLKKKDVINKYSNIIYFGYCEIYKLTRYMERLGYTSGIYGWNADVFHIDNKTCIVTGYRPFGNIQGNKYLDLINKKVQQLDVLTDKYDFNKVNINKYVLSLINEILKRENYEQ